MIPAVTDQEMGMTIRIAADIGGTFTDIAVVLENGSLATHKLQSSPADYADAAIRGIVALAGELGVAPDAITEILHGCTIATNVILEQKGAHTALVTTAGFRDVLELRRVRVPRLYDPLYEKPPPLVPRERRFEVAERIGATGDVVVPLDEEAVERVARLIAAEKVEAVAVCFLNSFVNPAHERRAGALLRRILPDCFVTLSVDVLPQIREYERTSSTVINAYIGPAVKSYLETMIAELAIAGVRGPLLIMQSSGGLIGAHAVVDKPAQIIECGPAAGVIGASRIGLAAGYRDLISFDMGGTTAKASLIENGRVLSADEYEVGGGITLSSKLVKDAGYVLKLPAIDIAEVGAGGGSIVWLDKANAIKVGPHSAGALPGPACYDTGGAAPTVTDANVVLGFLNDTSLAGGSVPIRAELARQAIATQIAGPLRRSLLDTAYGIHSVANTAMMRAVKSVTTYRGRDPRDFVLFAFGGNGGVHGVELARTLRIRRVVVPLAAGVFSAIGLLFAPVELTLTQGFLRRSDAIVLPDLEAAYDRLGREVERQMGASPGQVALRRQAELRYAGQAYELTVDAPPGTLNPAWLRALEQNFNAEHERIYGRRHGGGQAIELVTLKIIGAIPTARPARLARQINVSRPVVFERSAYFGSRFGSVATPVIARAQLDHMPRGGPLIVEEYEGTIVVPPDCCASLDDGGNIVIDVADSEGTAP